MGDAGSAVERVVELLGQGRTVVWDCPGPLGAPTLVLLHGVTLTAELNVSALSLARVALTGHDRDPRVRR